MSRVSRDDYDREGDLRNGYDYELQVWVKGYEVQVHSAVEGLS